MAEQYINRDRPLSATKGPFSARHGHFSALKGRFGAWKGWFKVSYVWQSSVSALLNMATTEAGNSSKSDQQPGNCTTLSKFQHDDSSVKDRIKNHTKPLLINIPKTLGA